MRVELLTPRLSRNWVSEVWRDMVGRGFTLVNMPPFCDDDLAVRLKRRRTVLAFEGKRWWQFPQLARYGCWLEGLLGRALPEESVSLTELEFRHEPAGSEDKEVDRLHADGSYIRSVGTLYGPSTVYRDGDAELSVPRGQTLLMTAMCRARALGVPCTLHRRPGAGTERAVIVCSLEPCQERAPEANVYRRAAQIDRARRRSARPHERNDATHEQGFHQGSGCPRWK